jgi:hypothetical protein
MDRSELERAAVENAHLRGLFGVPGGLLMILAALGNAEWGPFSHHAAFIAGVIVGVPLVIVGSMWLSSRASWSLDLPVNTIAITLGLVFLLSVAATVGLRTHHVVVYGGLVVLGAIPVWERGGESGNTGLWISGIAIIVGGLLDHRLLVRRFGPANLEDHDRAAA